MNQDDKWIEIADELNEVIDILVKAYSPPQVAYALLMHVSAIAKLDILRVRPDLSNNEASNVAKKALDAMYNSLLDCIREHGVTIDGEPLERN